MKHTRLIAEAWSLTWTLAEDRITGGSNAVDPTNHHRIGSKDSFLCISSSMRRIMSVYNVRIHQHFRYVASMILIIYRWVAAEARGRDMVDRDGKMARYMQMQSCKHGSSEDYSSINVRGCRTKNAACNAFSLVDRDVNPCMACMAHAHARPVSSLAAPAFCSLAGKEARRVDVLD